MQSSKVIDRRQGGSLLELLKHAATSSSKLYFHTREFCPRSKQPESCMTYAELYDKARSKALQLASLAKSYRQNALVLLHFESIELNIIWFWASLMAGISPVISTPLPNSLEQRAKHLDHLSKLLEQPIVLATELLLSHMSGTDGLEVTAVEKLGAQSIEGIELPQEPDVPFYMLTSGSSGNAKAVELSSQQIMASIHGKHKGLDSRSDDIFLNWIGFDHVANITECHLHAMYLSVDQHHVPAADVISDPILFLNLIHAYRVTASFGPNFFLARLCETLQDSSDIPKDLDLSCLRRINSGGDANLTETAVRIDAALKPFGAPSDLIIPGFGMTETCAGSIYSTLGRAYDVNKNMEFATLGKPVEGITMRVVREDGTTADADEQGTLQVAGPIVFSRYLNNPTATADAFTADGYFNTGDKAVIDGNGCLYLSGRDKEIINIDGQKYAPHELETALEETIQGENSIVPSSTVVFSIRPQNAAREEICVIYQPRFPIDDAKSRIRIADAITQCVGIRASARPKHIIALPSSQLPKSTLGKLSRAKLRNAFLEGKYREFEDRYNKEILSERERICEEPTSNTEKLILKEVRTMSAEAFDVPVGVNASIFDLGITSIDLFILSSRLQKRLEINQKIPVGTFFTDPTIRGIAGSIDQLGVGGEYVPIVPLQKEGNKTPLFLVHPGSGDVLIFVGLSKYFNDRPIYGIRTRCLYSGDDYHKTIHLMAQCYYENIKKIQPEGPYAIAGYSLGFSVAFEIAKLLEADGSKVPFLGILDSPPHIKHLIRDQDFIDVLLNVSYFLELITEEYAMVESIPMHEKSESEALDLVLQHAPPQRLRDLSIDKPPLKKITEVTLSFGTAGRDYDPEGTVANLDVFWVHPLLWVAPNRAEWMDKHLKHWVNFCRSEPQFHELKGSHSMMLNACQLHGTAVNIRSVIRSRGL
ncbi:unnamed protein product [Clonostachys byssicola]|uniref:Carrier domain-containing protein n=1 Tax=Clonostachys byssicola TaxID=160290 RepID=A0A9N9Y4K1_9HYPO|nr:unnamed protein product [Clonostachys byssicola]